MPIELGGDSPEPREVFFTEPAPRSDRPPVRTETLAGWGGPVPEHTSDLDREQDRGRDQRQREAQIRPSEESASRLISDLSDSPGPTDVAERFADDLAEPQIRAVIWDGLARVAEVLRPGTEADIRGTGEAARWFPGIPSVDGAEAAHPRVPVISDDSGLALGWRVRPGRPASALAGPKPPPVGAAPRQVSPAGEPLAGEPPLGETSQRRRGLWRLDPSGSPGAGASGVAVVTPRVEIRAATGRYEVSADALVEYVGARSAAAPAQAAPEVIVYGDPDTGVGLIALRPVDTPAYAPVCFRVELDGAETSTRFWGAPLAERRSARLPRPRQPSGPALGSRTARAEVTRAATNWPQLLEELADRFGGDISTLVRGAIAGSVATPVVARALHRFGPGAADTLSEVGAGGTAYLLARVVPLLPADYQERAVRYAVEEVVRWSLESGSAAAARCRGHLAHLLGASDVVGEVLEGAHRDLDRAGASALLRVVAPALSAPVPGSSRSDAPMVDSSPATRGRSDRDGWDERRDAVLEFVFEQLEAIAGEPGALHATLAGLLRDTV